MAEADPPNPAPDSHLSDSTDEDPCDPAEMTIADAAQLLAVGRATSRSVRARWQPPSVADLQKMLPQYEIRALIGRGGMGAVYRGMQRSLNRGVAIKILPPEMAAEDVQFPERFKLEAQAMAQLSHPGIVAVFDAGETADGLLYFVMEYVEGTDVQGMLAARGPLPAAEALPIVAHVCEALEFAHAGGFVHRDIKPSNIMVDVRGQVKVADFGLARAMVGEGDGLTQSMAIGTAEYSAPEAFLPDVKLDGRADLYSVGVMLYQMLTGQIPRGRFEGASARVAGLDPRIDAIVDRAMQTDPNRRYSTAREMRADIEGVLRSGGPQRRRGWLIGAGVAAAVVVVAAAAAMIFRGTAAPDASSETAPPPFSGATRPVWRPVPFRVNAPVENGFVHLVKFDYWNGQNLRITNGAVRAVIAWQPHQPGRNDYIKVTVRQSDPEHYYAYLAGSAVEAGHYLAPRVTPLHRWPLNPPPEPGESIALQLAVVGPHLAVWVRGKLLGTCDDTTVSDGGNVGAQAADGYFQNLEYLSLDDLSERDALNFLGLAPAP